MIAQHAEEAIDISFFFLGTTGIMMVIKKCMKKGWCLHCIDDIHIGGSCSIDYDFYDSIFSFIVPL